MNIICIEKKKKKRAQFTKRTHFLIATYVEKGLKIFKIFRISFNKYLCLDKLMEEFQNSRNFY